MIYKFIVFCILLIIPVGVMAEDENIDIKINDSLNILNFEQAQGSNYNFFINVLNESNENRKITLSVIGETTGLNILFFDDLLDEKYKEKLSQNNNDVISLCEDEIIRSEISDWCKGSSEITLNVPSKSNLKIYSTINVDEDATDENIEIVALNDEGIVNSQVEILYKVPNKGIKKIVLEKFVVNKESDSEYNINSIINNVGTEIVKYNFCTIVKSLWIDEEIKTCHNNDIEVGEKKSQKYGIIMPRFGKMVVNGGVEYVDGNGQLQQNYSNDIEIFVWSKKIVVISLMIICFCSIFVLLYKYINKNMFGLNKKKKENKNFTGKYVVKDADNMISIAQLYDIPWKELAEVNQIDPPYVLISGETILVPGDESDDNEELVENINNVDDSDNEVRTIGASAQLNQNQKSKQVEIGMKIDNMQKKEQNDESGKGEDSELDDIKKESEQSKRKITYAAPEKMLSKPASEPTTNAIDIEWMQDDEEMYAEEMQMQEKRMNIKIILVSIFLVTFLGVIAWWIAMIFINKTNKEEISVDKLIEENVENVIVKDEKTENPSNESEYNEDDIKPNDSEDSNSMDIEKQEEIVDDNDVSNIKIQVLNAGTKAGVAGGVTSEFEKNGYKVNNATNATNNYDGVVIYFASEKENYLEGVSAMLSDEYGDKKTEESNEVVKKYDVDFVIVLGT